MEIMTECFREDHPHQSYKNRKFVCLPTFPRSVTARAELVARFSLFPLASCTNKEHCASVVHRSKMV